MALNAFDKNLGLWFDDGNVVLVAEKTGFRVHRSVLARHSDVFRDMFLISQPEPPLNDEAKGCPIVPLVDDGAEDVATILGILYDGGQNFYQESSQIDFSTAAAALILGTKYAFEAIRSEALRRLSLCYPRDLKSLQEHGMCTSSCAIKRTPTDSMAVFRLARRFRLDDLVLAAPYKCTDDLSISTIFAESSNASKPLHALSRQELACCMEFREQMFHGNVSLYDIYTSGPQNPHCAYPNAGTEDQSPCSRARQCIVAHSISEGYLCANLYIFDPAADLVEPWKTHSEETRVCGNCTSYLTREFAATQARLWTNLREKFCNVSQDINVREGTED